MWVPAAHVGIACNAYADAVATAYLGNNDTEDASKVVRDAARTRPCMYTVRREAARVRGLDRLQRECGLWTVPGIACGIDVPLEVERLMSLALQEGETQTEE